MISVTRRRFLTQAAAGATVLPQPRVSLRDTHMRFLAGNGNGW